MGCLKAARILALCALFCLLPACSRQKAGREAGREIPASAIQLGPDLLTKSGNAAEFTFTERVVKMEQRAFLDSIRSISTDNRTFVFDPHDPTVSRLKEGSILFVANTAVRKVIATTEHEGYLVVVTADAPLVEAFKDAKIHWTTPVNFAEVQRQMRSAADPPSRFRLPQLETTAYADTPLSFSGDDDGWNYTVQASPQSDRLNLQMEVSRSYNGVVAKLTGAGHVQNFQNAVNIAIKDSQLETLDYKNVGLNGIMNFSWEAAKDSPGVEAAEQRVKLPSSFSIPLPIGGIPFSLEVSEALLIHPAFTGGKEVAKGRFRVEYSGDQGFKMNGGNLSEDGSGNADGSIVDHFSLAPIAPVGFVAAVAMPRVELKLGTDSVFQVVKHYAPPGLADGIVNALQKTPFGKWFQQQVSDKLKTTGAAYAQVVISTSTIAAGAGSLIPCQKAQVIITMTVGANATVLGQSKGNVSKDIFRQEKNITVPPLKACEV